MAEIDDATIARLQELCDHARADVATYGCGYDEACLLEIGELSVAALPALLEERETLRRDNVDKASAWDAIAEKNAKIARLRDELDAARLEIERLQAVLKWDVSDIARLREELDAARREIVRLRGVVDAADARYLDACAALEARAQPGQDAP